jgi:prepilin-type N-terminal cleavage/methylation domain-containing protein
MYVKNSRGDTIIEVLFAMAIVGVVLAAAYGIASKNLQTSQFARERSQATQIASTQIELIKNLRNAPTPTPPNSNFCVDINAANPVVSSSNPACTDGFFNTLVNFDGTDSYRIKVEWIPPGGDTNNLANVTFYYRLGS